MPLLNICLFGPPGAGKGTQSKMLLNKFNLTYIATGDLLRKEVEQGTELGLASREYMEQGMLVPDEIIVQLIERTIKSEPESNGFLFDGFPRTIIQAYILEGLMLKLNTTLSCMLNIEVPKDELMRRMMERAVLEKRSDDANMDVIRHRLQEYEDKTTMVAGFFKEQNKYCSVDGIGGVNDVSDRLMNSIETTLKTKWVNIVLSGPPGAGKGTQSKILCQKYNLVHIATGDLIRREIAEGTELGLKANQLINSGDLVPDEIVVKLIERKIKLNKKAKGFLFDGFPMNLVQAYILDGLLRKLNSSVTSMIFLDVSTLNCIKRLSGRWNTPERRSYDASMEIIIHRLEKYEYIKKVVNKYYESQNKFSRIDGTDEVDLVTSRLSSKVEEAFKNIR
jgi:adenylate kinase